METSQMFVGALKIIFSHDIQYDLFGHLCKVSDSLRGQSV